jgi:hypothetical protein
VAWAGKAARVRETATGKAVEWAVSEVVSAAAVRSRDPGLVGMVAVPMAVSTVRVTAVGGKGGGSALEMVAAALAVARTAVLWVARLVGVMAVVAMAQQ